MHHRAEVIALALVSLVSLGCHGSEPPARPSSPPPQEWREPSGLELQRAAHASPTGVLVVAGSIVRRCPVLDAMKSHPPAMDDDAAWFAILQNLADCMGRGSMKSERILVTGGDQAAPVVRYVLARMGIDRERIDVAKSAGDDDCDFDACTYFSVRVDLIQRNARR
jgi:hypothetical protein